VGKMGGGRDVVSCTKGGQRPPQGVLFDGLQRKREDRRGPSGGARVRVGEQGKNRFSGEGDERIKGGREEPEGVEIQNHGLCENKQRQRGGGLYLLTFRGEPLSRRGVQIAGRNR